MIKIDSVQYKDLKTEILSGNENWIIISAINFEECSCHLINEILESITDSIYKRIKLIPLKLSSKRSSPWSPLEVVKNMFSNNIIKKARSKNIVLEIRELEYPVGIDIVRHILFQASNFYKEKANIILDLSAMPREMTFYFTESICAKEVENNIMFSFHKIYALFTPPSNISSRKSIAPFSVGMPKCIFNNNLTDIIKHNYKNNILIFPGYEGFEAKTVVDLFLGHNANIVCAIDCSSNPFHERYIQMISNQSIFMDNIEKNLSIKYFFSSYDILRISMNFVKSALKLIDEFPQFGHTLIIAPFGSKSSIFLASFIGAFYKNECNKIAKLSKPIFDIIVLPTHQYVSLYSRGSKTPDIFKISNL